MSFTRERIHRFEGASPLQLNQFWDALDGTAILSGCDLEHVSGLEVRVTSGEPLLDGERRSWGGGTIAVDGGGSNDRKDVVYLRDNGTGGLELAIEKGLSADSAPTDADEPIEWHDPIEHDMAQIDGLPCGVVGVREGASSLNAAEDLWQYRPAPNLRPGSIGGVEMAYPEGGSAGVQRALDALPADGGTVLCAPGSYDWPTSVEVPDNCRLMATHRGAATAVVPAGHNLTAYDAPHAAASTYAAITTAGHSASSPTAHATIENIEVDYSAVTSADGNYNIGIWLYYATESEATRCYVHDVLPGNPEREFGIVATECESSTAIRQSRVDNCGYEGIGVRGRNEDVIVEDCVTRNNGTHSLQVAGWTGGGDNGYYGRPKNVEVRGGNYDGNVILHGIYDPTTTQTERDHNHVLEGVTAERFQLYENVRHIKLKDCTGMVRLVGRQVGDAEGYVGQIEIDGLEYNGFRSAPIEFEVTGDGVEMVDIRLSRIHGIADANNDAVIYVHNRTSTAATNVTIDRVTLADSNVEASSLVLVEDSDYAISGLRVDDNDLSDVTDILNPASATGAAVTVTRMVGNAGYANYIEGIGGTNPN